MAIRTIQILGMGFGSSPASVTASVNGTQVFTGTVTTVNQPVPSMPNFALVPDQVTLFTFEVDTTFTGTVPMTCNVYNGSVIFGEVFGNYIGVPNPVYTPEQVATITDPNVAFGQKLAIYTSVANPPFTPEEIAILQNQSIPYDPNKTDILNAHNCGLQVSGGANEYNVMQVGDVRSDVFVDGLEQNPDYDELQGPWWWTIRNGSTFTCNLEIPPAVV